MGGDLRRCGIGVAAWAPRALLVSHGAWRLLPALGLLTLR